VEFRQLEHVQAVAEEQSFTRAADRCGIAQSGLSLSIQALERELGITLFNRATRPVTLTQAGAAFLPEATRSLASAAAARRAVKSVNGLETGTIDIGAVNSLGDWWDFPALIARFHRRFPGIEITTRTGKLHELLDSVVTGTLDVALTGKPHEVPAGLSRLDLAALDYGVCCPTGHPLAGGAALETRDIVGERFIDLPEGNHIRSETDRQFELVGARRRVRMEVSDAKTALSLVAQGLGIACLPEPPNPPASVAFIRLGLWPAWTLELFSQQPEYANPPARALRQMASEFVAEHADLVLTDGPARHETSHDSRPQPVLVGDG
jgi:DNA-binding transcriptional LysR family regulator